MPQNMIELPQEAEFDIEGFHVVIQNHRVKTYDHSLLGAIIMITRNTSIDVNTLQQFERHGISYEAAVEECAYELENNASALAWVIYWSHDSARIKDATTGNTREEVDIYAASDRGRKIAAQYIEKIRSCDDWQQLYEQLHYNSPFQKEMEGKVLAEIEQ